MQITRVDIFTLKLDVKEAYLGALPDGSALVDLTVRPPWRSLYTSRYPTVLVKITADDGTTGWGEALSSPVPEVVATIIERMLAPQLLGKDPQQVRPLHAALRDLMRERGHLVGHQADALAAIDIALWDLASRALAVPLVVLLGGSFRDEVPSYVSGLPRPTDPERAELAASWQQRGAQAVKLHLGYGVRKDLATIDAIMAAAPGLDIALDAHWVYDLPDAIRLGRGLDERGVLWLEAPMAPEDIHGHAELARRIVTPIAVGEAMRNRFEFANWIDAGALGVAQPDVGRTGITEALAIAEHAATRNLKVTPHHSIAQGIAIAAGLHLSAAIENLWMYEYQPNSAQVAERLLRSPIELSNGSVALPAGPGLGIEVDEEAVVGNAIAHAVVAAGEKKER